VLQTSLGCASPPVWTTTIPNSRVVSTVAPGNDLRSMISLCTATGTTQYRGELGVLWADNGQRTVNTVLMEDYLRGVVPRESPASWGDAGAGRGMEALKSQAVAARSYAWAENRATWAKTCDTTSCQVYLGAGSNLGPLEDRRTDAAIAGTAGVVLRNAGGSIVRAEFSSSTGGWTAGGAFPSIRDDGDTASPYHDWSQVVPAATIGSAFGVGQLISIRVTDRNGLGADGGRVLKLEVVGTAKSVVVSGSSARTTLGLRSDWFVVGAAPVNAPPPPAPSAAPTVYQGSGNVSSVGTAVPFGEARDTPLSCDWNGDGVDSLGVFRTGTFFYSTGTAGGAVASFGFGQSGDQPVCGDWDGDGRDTPGLLRNGVVFLRNTLTSGVADGQFFFGGPGDTLVTGDWNGDGFDTVGVWRAGTYYLSQSNLRVRTDVVVAYGDRTDLPTVGDWDGNGTDTLGAFRNGDFLLRNSTTAGLADLRVAFGQPGDRPLVGAWRARGTSVVGVARGY
jgi:SpoIID/LytB domain protein